MGLLHALFNKIAYQPPENPSYTLEEENEKLKLKLALFRDNPPWYHQECPDNVEVDKIRTKRGNDIVTVYVNNPSASLTLLYSHSNAQDLGLLIRIKCLEKLSDDLGVNIMTYDYSGYGQSTGKPSEKNSYADIEAAYGCLVEKYGAKEEDVILYGCSIGAGPTTDLATRLPKLRGVVLEGAFTSIFRLVNLHKICGLGLKKGSHSFDIYNNLEKIPLVCCPVLVIHGTNDELVDLSHGQQLWSQSKCKYEPLWIEEGSHLNNYSRYKEHLKKFVSDMEIRNNQSIDHEEKSRAKSEDILCKSAGEEQARNGNAKSFRSVRLLNCFKTKLEQTSHK
ncbi:uncharacterized protein LOC126803600 [Argentina anserina]|uniref:uncharacterized protein LOC126803600 n=1 Tax=Argentina anserina TaxID=57926 RepID=UPI0021765EDF|nr:uncharacterized protein LOC126803600 [Potentilla anserina]